MSSRSITQPPDSSSIHRVSVAVAATLSLAATSFLLIYVMLLFILSNWKIADAPDPAGYLQSRANEYKNSDLQQDSGRPKPVKRKIWLQSWARYRLSFIKTPCGIMFLNLVVADFIQAMGFGINYFWVSNLGCDTPSCRTTCTIQGVFIQIGDVASAFSNLMIAIQTFVILTISWNLPNWITWVSLLLIWISVFLLGLTAPTIMGKWSGPTPFYAWTGDWCWINTQFSPLRLLLHYLWIFISAFGSIALYGHLFIRLKIYIKGAKGNRGIGLIGGKSKYGTVSTSFLENQVIPAPGDHLRKKIERKARAMLMYPIAFIFLILPLSAYRLASLAGHDWGITAATICGTMYCLSGFVDVLLFGTTRSILSIPIFSLSDSVTGKTGAFRSNGMAMSSSGFNIGRTRSSAFGVQVFQETVIDLDESNDSAQKMHEERPNQFRSGGDASSKSAFNPNSLYRGGSPVTILVDPNSLIKPLPNSLKYSRTMISRSDMECENRSTTLAACPSDVIHPASTNPTPWYEPSSTKK